MLNNTIFKNICFIGMPYAGKSYLGNLSYKIYSKGFIDTDNLIKSRYNKDLHKIIKEQGELNFLHLENKIIKTIICKNTIISTGGSVIYNKSSMDHIKNNLNADIYHLYISYDEYLKRLNKIESRGIINFKNQSLNELYTERIALYNYYSDYTINVDCLDNNKLISWLKNN